MSSNPFMVLDFSNQLTQQRPLTEIGAGVNQVVTQRQQEAAAAAAQKQYQSDLAAYMDDPTPENRMAVLESGNNIGRFDQVKQQIESFDTATRQQELQEISNLYGPLRTGNTDVALNYLDRQIQAMEGAAAESGAVPEELVELREIREAVESGNFDPFLRELELELAFMGEEGERVIGNFSTLAEEVREEEEHTLDLLKDSVETIIPSEEDRELIRPVLDGFRNTDFANMLLDIFRTSEDGAGIDAESRHRLLQQYRDRWYDETKDFRRYNQLYSQAQAAGLRALIGSQMGFEDSVLGASDMALVDALKRMTDDAVVRATDLSTIQSTEGTMSADGFRQRWDRFTEGDLLTDDQRREMLSLASELSAVASGMEENSREFVDRHVPSIGLTGEDIYGDAIFDRSEEGVLETIKSAMISSEPQQAQSIRNISSFEELRSYSPQIYDFATKIYPITREGQGAPEGSGGQSYIPQGLDPEVNYVETTPPAQRGSVTTLPVVPTSETDRIGIARALRHIYPLDGRQQNGLWIEDMSVEQLKNTYRNGWELIFGSEDDEDDTTPLVVD